MIVHTQQGEPDNISTQYLGIYKMKIDLTTGTWQDNPGCPINITLVSTSDDYFRHRCHRQFLRDHHDTDSMVSTCSRPDGQPQVGKREFKSLQLEATRISVVKTSSE